MALAFGGIEISGLKDPALRRDRQAMVTALKNGDAETQGIINVKMVKFAKSIVDRDLSTWSSDEAEFVRFLQALAQNQRQKAGELADLAFKDWQFQEAKR